MKTPDIFPYRKTPPCKDCKAAFVALADEAFLCIKLLNEPLLSRNEP